MWFFPILDFQRILLFLCVTTLKCSKTESSHQSIGKSSLGKCGQVHLTVTASDDTNLELNWISNCNSKDLLPDYIALYNTSILDRNEHAVPFVKINASDYPEGYYKTKVKFGHPWLPGNWEYREDLTRVDPGPHCFPYWVASIKNDNVVDSKCLAIQPTWMTDHQDRIGPQKLGNIFLPGTHNSGAFNGVPNFLEKYVLCQDRSIWTQLVHGIRYLDFRVGYYENEGFYINHDLVRIMKIEPLFLEIRKFLQLAPMEILILDFHRFPFPTNFNSTLHSKFASLVYQYLGDLALPASDFQMGKGPTFNEIWKQNKSLIISYADEQTARDNPWLWQPINQNWADTKHLDRLEEFLENAIKDHKQTINPTYALMAELTPQPIDVIFGLNNIKKLANQANRKVTQWFRDQWGPDSNIVATDFFLGNDIINVAIDVNSNR